MNWSDEWRKLVLGSSLRKSGDPFTSGEYVDWYDLQLEHNNYPGVLLDKVQRHLNENSTVLDIGAGTGAFAFPIAQLVKAVTVVEPSAEMLTHLRRKMDTTNIRIINKRWEDVTLKEVGQHDLVLAAHSLYGIADIEAEMKKMLAVAKKHFCFIIRVGRQDFYADIWRRFKREEFRSPPGFIHLYNLLYELGLVANVEMVQTVRDQVYLNLEQAVKHWRVRLDLAPEKEDDLRAYLLDFLEERGGKLYWREERPTAVITTGLLVGNAGEAGNTDNAGGAGC
ncbi:class I SAM-dependent methyltransferase [Thermodesulfovibrionales bacterium]|nr:class I SAM-dependent methyltransferase [Thermodesulfovibrionales bacterium]